MLMRSRTFTMMGLLWALVACALLTIGPTLARAQQATQQSDPLWLAFHELCRADGSHRPALPDDNGALHASHDDCRYCQLTSSLTEPPSASTTPLPSVGHTTVAPAFWRAPHRLHAWRAAAPRGPPHCA
ncbi:MAG: DUF2946 domain-containing protein [Betaproteobacteria bacterium]|nr:DUF2946 domain-containing protein [Betaproteobacteria bacterium]NBT10739.1 DUF2946 domain-containing protein [Betaproteobacteria bacterium]NBU50726.1 DUF2946 domain-containing protein [Betaproteobacteria bacterium]